SKRRDQIVGVAGLLQERQGFEVVLQRGPLLSQPGVERSNVGPFRRHGRLVSGLFVEVERLLLIPESICEARLQEDDNTQILQGVAYLGGILRLTKNCEGHFKVLTGFVEVALVEVDLSNERLDPAL